MCHSGSKSLQYCLAALALLMFSLPGHASAPLPHDLSAWGMFQQADWVVKGVMLGLLLASVLTWTIWLLKTRQLRQARKDNEAPLQRLNSANSFEQCQAARSGAAGALLAAANAELEQSKGLPRTGVIERLEGRFARVESALSRRAKAGTGSLATVGSTAPFIGLFGTVWGIMNSFIGISQAQTTNLAVVAPGIAEALLATALGLVAAIPAVMMYNQFSRKIGDYRAEVTDMAGELMRLVSLHLDRQEKH